MGWICGMTRQMTEVSLNHKLESLCCTRSVTGDHGTASHDIANGCRMRIKTLCSDLMDMVSASCVCRRNEIYSICQVLRSEYAAQTLFIVDYKDTVGTLGGT